jgi:hypothetical protein
VNETPFNRPLDCLRLETILGFAQPLCRAHLPTVWGLPPWIVGAHPWR